MKLSLTFLAAALVASTASAAPARRVYIASDDLSLAENAEEMENSLLPQYETEQESTHTQEETSTSAEDESSFGPVAALLSRLGFASDGPGAGSNLEADFRSGSASVLELWRTQVEEILNDAVPIIEGGVVRILTSASGEDSAEVEDAEAFEEGWGDVAKPQDELNDVRWWRMIEGGQYQVKDGEGEWRNPVQGEHPPMGKPAPKSTRIQALEAEEEGRLSRDRAAHAQGQTHKHYRTHHYHHRIATTLTDRIQRVIRSLRPIEAVAFALVFGAGFGAVVHCIFMLLLLSYRRVVYGSNDEARLARRAARREARRAKKALKAGAIRLEGEDGLPNYESGESDSSVAEKA